MASALENYVNNVRTLSANGKFRDLADNLNDNTVELLAKNWLILDNVLETLDVQQHSLGVLYVLLAKFKVATSSNLDGNKLLQLCKEFIQLSNGEQVRFATHAYFELCHRFTNFIMDKPYRRQGIKVLAHAIEKIRLFESQLTPVHADLCQLCLKTKHFQFAVQFLDIDITSIAVAADPNHVSADLQNEKFFLLYYYYGGMIYTSLKNFERAVYFFEVCISTPAMALSYIMLEAYKKFILVSLILQGKLMRLPKFPTQTITRFMKPFAFAYLELSNAYSTSSSVELRNVINKNNEVYVSDKNTGLVSQVAMSLHKKNIRRLTKTFLTLSLSDVANRVQLADANAAESYILKMIKDGEIYASINEKDGMVIFKDPPERYNTPEMFHAIQRDTQQVIELMKNIARMEEGVKLNPVYIKKTSNTHDDELTQQSKQYTG